MHLPTVTAYPGPSVYGATDEHHEAAALIRRSFRIGGLATLGATNLAAVPGIHRLGGLLFTARILPMTKAGDRSERPAKMAVLASLTGAYEVDIEVRRTSDRSEHVRIEGLHLHRLERVAVALDYDGPELLNPRYWPEV